MKEALVCPAQLHQPLNAHGVLTSTPGIILLDNTDTIKRGINNLHHQILNMQVQQVQVINKKEIVRGGAGQSTGHFTPPKNDQEARRWVKQAVADYKALLDKARTEVQLSCHVCFMAHEVAEKALKGATYATCGLRENSQQSHNIIPLASSGRTKKASGLSTLTAPLEPTYYIDTRFPKQSSPSSVPSENFSLDEAAVASACAECILKIVRKIVNVDI